MFFHYLMLDDFLKELCTINTAFGLYWFIWLPQGAKVLPDLAQAVIEQIVQDIDTDAYMDNCMLFTNQDFAHHIDLIDILLAVLAKQEWSVIPWNVRGLFKKQAF